MWSHVKSLWCRHWCTKRNRSRLCRLFLRCSWVSLSLCVRHSLCSLFYSTSVVTSGLWIPGGVKLFQSATVSPEREAESQLHQSEATYAQKTKFCALPELLSKQTYFCDAVLNHDRVTHRFAAPASKAKNKEQDQLQRAHRAAGWFSVARGHLSREDACCRGAIETRPLTHSVTLLSK